jgi:aminomethyltransferase
MTAVETIASAVGFPTVTVYETVGDAVVPWRFGTHDEDYRAIRHGCALIDLSGAGLIGIDGDAGREILERSLSVDVSYMTPERTMMGLVLADDGRPVDVVTVYRTDDGYRLQTTVGRGTAVEALLRDGAGADAASVADRRSEDVVISVEGPASMAAVGEVVSEPVEGMPFQAVRVVEFAGRSVVMSRTGSSGEYGFTFIVARPLAAELWGALAEHSQPAGIEAVETAMVEVRQPLLHRELLDDDTVITAGLNWLVDLQKEQFVGRDAIQAEFDAGPAAARVSVVAPVPFARGAELTLDGDPLGVIAHATFSPSLGAYCGIARVDRSAMVSGLTFGLDGAEVVRSVSTPMVVPSSWSSLQG